jgi:alanyl-tRNA synthetase
VTSLERADADLRITVVHGGDADTDTLEAIERAVRSVVEATRRSKTREVPAWRSASRLEGTMPVRIRSRAQLRSGRAT